MAGCAATIVPNNCANWRTEPLCLDLNFVASCCKDLAYCLRWGVRPRGPAVDRFKPSWFGLGALP